MLLELNITSYYNKINGIWKGFFMIDILFLGIDAWLLYIAYKYENTLLLGLVLISLLIDFFGAIEILSMIRI